MDVGMLHCIICPEQPRFSDVSHLLTHVASKAHLSNYFKLQVRSHQDDDALELLQAYDAWYNTNELAQLLSDRMTSKESRKKKRKSNAKASARSPRRSPPKRTRRVQPVDPSPREHKSFPDFLDPRLVGAENVKREDRDADDSLVSCYVTPVPSAVTESQASSHAEIIRDSTPSLVTANLVQWRRADQYGSGDPINLAMPMTPRPLRTRNRRSGVSLALCNDISDPFVDSNQRNQVSDDAEVDRERAEEMARLKGILWPGMDIFDSATEQMRRKRNQKKDGNVLKMMEITSLLVEPTELVFSPTGILRRERVISGDVDNDSPLKGETPIPKRRPTRPRREALRATDPNVSRAQDRKRAQKPAPQSRNRSQKVLSRENSGSPHSFTRMASLKPSYNELDSDLELSTQAFGKRPRSCFTIFADEDHHDKDDFKDLPGTKLPRETLTPARLMLDRKSDATNNHGCKIGQPTLDKENIEPILNPQGRIDFHTWGSPLHKRSNSDGRYAPRYFFDDQSSAGLEQDEDRHKSGYQRNPLLAPTSKAVYYEPHTDSNIFDESVTVTGNGWKAVPRAVSEDGTISEDDHDLARLYLNGGAE